MSKFVTISIPEEFGEKIDEQLGKHGYRSRADLVVDAIRRRLEELAKGE